MFLRVRLRFPAIALSLLSCTMLLYYYAARRTQSSTEVRAIPDSSTLQGELSSFKIGPAPEMVSQSSRKFNPTKPLPPDYAYTKTIVVPKMKREDTSWLDEELPSIPKAIYVVDD